MKIGYPCINRSIGCQATKTFRLASYSEERLYETVENNLQCLYRILEYNVRQGIYFFRLSSDLVPFASHPVNKFNWGQAFAQLFREIGEFIRRNDIRISMHPDQFVLLNALDNRIVGSSIEELRYHARVLDLLQLDRSAKIQIHVGGVYGDKTAGIARFIERYRALDGAIRNRLVIENDDRLFSLADCLRIHRETGVPILYDDFHHAILSDGEPRAEAMRAAAATWSPGDGSMMVDYSTQESGARIGKHCESIDVKHFARFLAESKGIDFDVMLEIKDKEQSALKALAAADRDRRLHAPRTKYLRSLLQP